MTQPQPPQNFGPPAPAPKGKVPVILWVLGGCGCLVVAGFLGLILLSIALPSFLNQVKVARGSEAKANLGTINRAQQAHFLEKNRFASATEELDATVSGQLFQYEVVPSNNPTRAIAIATPIAPDLKGHTGFVFIIDPNSFETVQGICEGETATPPPPPNPPLAGAEVECPAGSTLIR